MNQTFNDFGIGKPIVLLHAFPLSSEMWSQQIEALVMSGFRVILPDLPGFGQNTSSKTTLTIDEMATSVFNVITLLKVERAIIGGLSMGGYVALNLFQRFPAIFSGIILCDTTSLPDTDSKRKSRFDLIQKIEKRGIEALIDEMIPKLISPYSQQNNPKLVEALKSEIAKVAPQIAIAALKGMAARPDTSEVLLQISNPCALIFGEYDQITPADEDKIMQQRKINSNFYLIKKAGHLSNLEQPKQFNKALIDFCREVDY